MSLPSPNLTPPSLSVDQASFQGLTFGATTPYEWTKVEGIGKAHLRTSTNGRPQTRGTFVGLNLLDARVITFTLDIGPPFGASTNLAGALSLMRAAVSTEGVTEYPLWIQLPNYPLLACMARVTGFDPPYDFQADIGGTGLGLMTSVPLQFTCADPYFYAAPTTSTSMALPTPGVGFGFNLHFNLSFGGASGGNMATVTNSGNVPCAPTLVITGPCLNPTISNLSITGGPTLNLNLQLNSGDVLMIDCDMQTIMYTPSGSSVAAPAPQVLMANSTFWMLQPGANVVSFNSQDTSHVSGTLAVWGASTYDGITG